MGCYNSKASQSTKTIHSLNQVPISASLFIRVNERQFETVYKLGRQLDINLYQCTHLGTGSQREVRVFSRSEKMSQEIEILRTLDHPSLIRVFESFIESEFVYIVMEHCKGGDLLQEILRRKCFKEEDCAVIMRQLFSAIAYLHENSIAHRNIKPEIILFEDRKSSLDIKLCNFTNATQCTSKMRGYLGSAYYVSPEMLSGYYSHLCDEWGAGVIMYILLSGYPPFDGEDEDEILRNVSKGEFVFEDTVWENVSVEAKNLIRRLLTTETERISAIEALQDQWIRNFASLKENSTAVNRVLRQLTNFKAENKFQQAISTFITSQLMASRETKEVRDVFQSLDTNGDGRLSREELLNGYQKLLGDKAEDYIDSIMSAVDSDKNGSIEYTEFLRVTIGKKKMLCEQNLKYAFDIFDYDQSGTISVQEVKKMLMGNNEADDEIWMKLVAEVDLNGDGEIDIDEFRRILTNAMYEK